MKQNYKFYLAVEMVLFIVSIWDYFYFVPYNISFENALIFHSTDRISLFWCLLFYAGICSLIPLFKNKKIGYVGLFVFVVILFKPIIITNIPEETAEQFFLERKESMIEFVQNYDDSKKQNTINKEVNKLGFEQFQKEGDTYIFIVNGLLDNSFGFAFDADDSPPENILNANASLVKIERNWYQFSTT